MKLHLEYYITLLMVIFLVGCENEQKQLIYRMLDAEKTIIKLDKINEEFGYITRFAVDEDESIYVFDDANYTLMKFNPKGELIAQTGRKGNGPGEFAEGITYFLKYTNNKIHVYSVEQQSINMFSKNLTYDSTKYYQNIFFSYDYDNTGNSIFSFMSHLNDEVLIYNNKRLNNDLYLDETNLFYNIMHVSFYDSSKFIGAYPYRNKIEIICITCDTKKENTTHTIPTFPEFSEVKEPYVPEKIIVQDIAITADGEIWVLGGDHSVNSRKEIHVFSINRGYKYTFKLPKETPQIVIINDHLYALNKDRISLTRYKIK